MSLAILILSVCLADGFGLMSTLLLSFLSTLIGYGSRWSLALGARGHNRKLPDDCVVVNYPNGAFDVVICNEDVARELYWHPEQCTYHRGNTQYRIVSLLATLILMFGVICLANASLPLQLSFAAAYMILNAAYWVVAALPPQWHWNLSCYEVTDVMDHVTDTEKKNFTRALWKTICLTGTSEWVKDSRIAPNNKAWGLWVQRAGLEAEQWAREMGRGDWKGAWAWPAWDPDLALTGFINGGGEGAEAGEEKSPLVCRTALLDNMLAQPRKGVTV